MDTALPQKFPFILDRNLAKANCTENPVCTSYDTVVFDFFLYLDSGMAILVTIYACYAYVSRFCGSY